MPIVEGRGTTCTTVLSMRTFQSSAFRRSVWYLGQVGITVVTLCPCVRHIFSPVRISFRDNRVNKVDYYWT